MSRKPGVVGSLWNFVSKLNPFSRRPQCAGIDKFGNKYMLLPADPSKGIRKETRYIVPSKRIKHEYEERLGMGIPLEWNAWLRHTREEPPTEEEMEINKIKRARVQERARELEQKLHEAAEASTEDETQDSVAKTIKGNQKKQPYPVYDLYESEPGETKRKGKPDD